MSQTIVDEFGNRFAFIDGELVPAEQASMLELAGRQFADFGSGAKAAYGELFDRPAMVAAADLETAARNEAFRGSDELDPIRNMVGQALPGAATAIISAPSVVGGLITSTGIGALESALDYGEPGTFAQRGAAGALGGALGEVGGRMIGRVWNMARGLADDLSAAVTGRGAAANPAAQAYEDLGGSTLAYQRMEQGTRPQRLAERVTRGAEASANPPSVLREAFEANDALHNAAAIEAVGLNPDQYRVLGRDFTRDALDRFNQEFSDVAQVAAGAGDIVLDDVSAKKIAKLPEIKELIELGEFQGLAEGKISGQEWMTAREAITEAASNRFANGRSKAGERLYGIVDDLDAQIGRYVPEDYLPQYARLREQYRVFKTLEAPNVIGNDGNVNVRSLRRRLDSTGSGFGRTATGGGETTNTETSRLIELMQTADNPEFKAFSSSGTAENLAVNNLLSEGAVAARDLAGGDPRSMLGLGGKLMAPGVIGASQMGRGSTFTGAFTPAPGPARFAGEAAGRSMLDELLYPFVGVQDERQQQ
jgi:hypothetical protein